MQLGQQPNTIRAPGGTRLHRRLIASAVFAAIATAFGSLWLAQVYKVDVGRWFGPCGLKQKYGLPCPTCGMTTAALSFARGDIWGAFYAQPAGGLLCCGTVAVAIVALVVAVFGIRTPFLTQVKLWQVVVILVVVILAGWAVTLARALAER